MLYLDKQLITQIRRVLIELLNYLDDALGNPRTIPDKETRRRLRQQDKHIEL